jgi:hypothetical protein
VDDYLIPINALCMTQIRMKYGRTVRATPITTNSIALEMKYGKIMRTRPQTSGTTALCLLPYTKKPRPIELNSKPQSSDDILKLASHDD